MTSFLPLAAIGENSIEKHIELVKGFLEKSSQKLPTSKIDASQFLLSILQNKELDVKHHNIANAIFLLLIPYGLTAIQKYDDEERLRACLARSSHIRAEDLKTWLPQNEGIDSKKASSAISTLYDSAQELLPSYTYEIHPFLQLLAQSLNK